MMINTAGLKNFEIHSVGPEEIAIICSGDDDFTKVFVSTVDSLDVIVEAAASHLVSPDHRS
jgi:hypothetical protein